GIALDAASRGLSVILIEKSDFANGTSSKSTKLIHGGLRYLKNFEIGLVREVGRERATVHKVAPHLVVPNKMLLPFFENGTFGPVGTSIGLWVYDKLANVKGNDQRQMLSREKTISKEPLLKKEGLKGAGYYAEYRADDARLTIENIKTAIDHGAVCLNYLKAEKFLYNDSGKISGIQCSDQLAEKSLDIQATYVVNATGPWTDILRKKDDGSALEKLFLSKGVHIVFPKERFPLNQAIYFDVEDGRMIFAIPHHRCTYVGTTDTKFDGNIDDIRVTKDEAAYLLQATNKMFPSLDLTMTDIESSWAGLRPLIFKGGKSAGELSRKDEIFISENDLITITGGKLTGYRKMAEDVVDLVTRKLKKHTGKVFKEVNTDKILLTGGPFRSPQELAEYKTMIANQIQDRGLDGFLTEYFLENYGRQCDQILEKAHSFDDINPTDKLVRAEVWFAIHFELAHTPLDFFSNRTGRLNYDCPGISKIKSLVISEFASWFNWDDQFTTKAEKELDQAMKIMVEFK
ncbi:MAG: glycerol-3-phosphate dehydrogenase/oxidase, partial [Bacteroidetes bacterium]